MSFLFKSKQKEAPKGALPPATRDIKSSDGPQSGSQIPTLNGMVNNNNNNPARAQSPAAAQHGPSVNGSLNSLAGNVDSSRNPSRGPAEERMAFGSGPPSPDHNKSGSMRSGMNGQEVVGRDIGIEGCGGRLTLSAGSTASRANATVATSATANERQRSVPIPMVISPAQFYRLAYQPFPTVRRSSERDCE